MIWRRSKSSSLAMHLAPRRHGHVRSRYFGRSNLRARSSHRSPLSVESKASGFETGDHISTMVAFNATPTLSLLYPRCPFYSIQCPHHLLRTACRPPSLIRTQKRDFKTHNRLTALSAPLRNLLYRPIQGISSPVPRHPEVSRSRRRISRTLPTMRTSRSMRWDNALEGKPPCTTSEWRLRPNLMDCRIFRTASQLRADPNYAIQHAARVIGRTIESWRSLRKIINDGFSWNRAFSSDHYTPAYVHDINLF